MTEETIEKLRDKIMDNIEHGVALERSERKEDYLQINNRLDRLEIKIDAALKRCEESPNENSLAKNPMWWLVLILAGGGGAPDILNALNTAMGL